MNAAAAAITAGLLHFVWQGAAAGVLLAVVLAGMRRHSANARYLVSCGALAALAVLPVVTAVLSVRQAPQALVTTAVAQGQTTGIDLLYQPGGRAVAPANWLVWLRAWAFPAWTVGVLLCSLRLVAGGAHVFRLKRHSAAAGAALSEAVARLARRLGVHRPVHVLIAAMADGPGVVGWLRPVILLPPAAVMGLTPQQLEAVLAHELAHIRRHDYLVNLLQMVVETLLFYHPAVWWVSRRIRTERELCCDDVAVGSCGDAAGYARALVTLAKQQVGMPVMAVPSTGGSLSDRIHRLLGTDARTSAPSRLPGLVAALIALACLALNVNGVRGQSRTDSAPRQRFEVASIKPSPPGARGYRGVEMLPGGTVRGITVPLFLLINAAYDLEWRQLEGESDLLSQRFDIDARAGGNALPESATAEQRMEQLREMLKALLAERFKLAVHAEQRDSAIYALVVGRNGHKIKPAECTVIACGGGGGGPANGLKVRNRTIEELAGMLTTFVDRRVLDRTGLTGRYDFDLPPWNPGTFAPPNDPDNQEPRPDPSGPALGTVLQETIGLRLESSRALLDVYIVDRVEALTPD